MYKMMDGYEFPANLLNTMLPRIEIDGIDYVNRLHKSASL